MPQAQHHLRGTRNIISNGARTSLFIFGTNERCYGVAVNEVALRANDVMLRINDVALCANEAETDHLTAEMPLIFNQRYDIIDL